jgi:hypothetical protein
MREVVQGI